MSETSNHKLRELLTHFAPKEYASLALAILLSIPILIYGLGSDTVDEVERGFKPIVATERVYDTNGNRVQLFDTSFYIAYENNASEIEIALVEEVLNEYLVPYHQLFDRHASYFAEDIANPSRPTSEEQANTPLVHNVKYINDHLGEFVEVDFALYDLLTKAQELAIFSQGYFNPFLGELTDFWTDILGYEEYPTALDPTVNIDKKNELESILSFVPKTAAELEAALTFNHDVINDRYYVRLNPHHDAKQGEMSLTLGGIAKGYLTDVMQSVMVQNKLYRGYINGGASSITTVSPTYFGEALNVSMASIYIDEVGRRDPNASFRFNRQDSYSMSTSGTYEGKWFKHVESGVDYLRSHIIDPFTGYPASQPHQLVTVVSNEISGTELEILSTSLVVMSQEEGVNFISDNYTDIDFNIVYLSYENGEYLLERNEDFPGGNSPYFHVSEIYRENFLEI